MPTLAVTPADVLARWLGGDAPTATDATLGVFIEDALELIRVEFADVDARVEAGTQSLPLVKKAVAEMVIRAWKVGYEYRTSYSENVASFAHSASYGSEETRRGVYLTDEERALLRPAAVSQESAFSLSRYGSIEHLNHWIPTNTERRPL